MKTLVAADDDQEFFKMLGQPFTFDWVSTRGGERVIIARGVEWPSGQVQLLFDDMSTLMKHEPSDVEISWHGAHVDD